MKVSNISVFGLTTIKGFGEGIAQAVITERKENGRCTSLEDFLNRVTDRNLNKKSLEALIRCGAMDELGDRAEMYANLEALVQYNREVAKGPQNQGSLFGAAEGPALRLEPTEPLPTEQTLLWEKELLGLYVTGNPLTPFEEKIRSKCASIPKIKESKKEGATFTLGGIIEDVRVIRTKKGDEMAFIRFADFDDTIEMVAFPTTYEKNRDLLQPDTCMVLEGKLSMRNDEPSIILEKAKRLKQQVQ